MDNKFGEIIGSLVYGFFLMAIIAVLMGYPLMLLWNYVMPELFGLAEIDFFHALALNILSGILFGKSSNSSPRKIKKKVVTNDSN